MTSAIPLGLLLTYDKIWQNSVSTREFKAGLASITCNDSNAAVAVLAQRRKQQFNWRHVPLFYVGVNSETAGGLSRLDHGDCAL